MYKYIQNLIVYQKQHRGFWYARFLLHEWRW
jgi:hypothetical protein